MTQADLEKKVDDLAEEVATLAGMVRKLFKKEMVEKEEVSMSSNVAVQIKRSKLTALICDIESNETKGTAEELMSYQRQFDKLPTVVDIEEVQTMLDLFDWDKCVEVAEKLGYTYGMSNSPITKEMLVEEALEMVDHLMKDNCKSGRMQRGRLVVNKFWDEEEDEPWYTMEFFIEMIDG